MLMTKVEALAQELEVRKPRLVDRSVYRGNAGHNDMTTEAYYR